MAPMSADRSEPIKITIKIRIKGERRAGGCMWYPGAVTPLQPLILLGDLEVRAVTKPLQGRYRALQILSPSLKSKVKSPKWLTTEGSARGGTNLLSDLVSNVH